MAIPISNAAFRRLGCGLREVIWLHIPEAPVVLEAKVLPDDVCLLRQDLYFDKENLPFLVVHWKHALSAIRLLTSFLETKPGWWNRYDF